MKMHEICLSHSYEVKDNSNIMKVFFSHCRARREVIGQIMFHSLYSKLSH